VRLLVRREGAASRVHPATAAPVPVA
jgi:hypothetical protein